MWSYNSSTRILTNWISGTTNLVKVITSPSDWPYISCLMLEGVSKTENVISSSVCELCNPLSSIHVQILCWGMERRFPPRGMKFFKFKGESSQILCRDLRSVVFGCSDDTFICEGNAVHRTFFSRYNAYMFALLISKLHEKWPCSLPKIMNWRFSMYKPNGNSRVLSPFPVPRVGKRAQWQISPPTARISINGKCLLNIHTWINVISGVNINFKLKAYYYRINMLQIAPSIIKFVSRIQSFSHQLDWRKFVVLWNSTFRAFFVEWMPLL